MTGVQTCALPICGFRRVHLRLNLIFGLELHPVERGLEPVSLVPPGGDAPESGLDLSQRHPADGCEAVTVLTRDEVEDRPPVLGAVFFSSTATAISASSSSSALEPTIAVVRASAIFCISAAVFVIEAANLRHPPTRSTTSSPVSSSTRSTSTGANSFCWPISSW